MVKSRDILCEVHDKEEILPGVFRTAFKCPEIAEIAAPGQFVQIEPALETFPVTRRPLTINRAWGDCLEVVFDVVGRGTHALSRLRSGERARILGPLGNGWDTSCEGDWVCIGGGLGAAGFSFLAENVRCRMIVIGASSNKRVLPLSDVAPVTIATEDGSMGEKGLITTLVTPELLESAGAVALCGPVAMMEAVWNASPEYCRDKIQVSTESRMGCGWGVCEGCSIPVLPDGYLKCCTDGPVFPGTIIDWKRWKEAGL